MNKKTWNRAVTHLGNACPVMHGIIKQYKGEGLQLRPDGFYSLTRAIVGQQISVKAADSVWAKFEAACHPFTPQTVLKQPIATLRTCGLSEQKANYVHNIARFYTDKPRDASGWEGISDAEAIEALTSIKGVGRWTAEMFLIFHLGRLDMWPVQDIGLLKALHRYYPEIPELPRGKYHPKATYEGFSKRFKPYRSVATWYLWRALDPVPVAY
jgi:DNA-3-methyladenine glycosylase II